MNHKIFVFIDDIEESYGESVELVSGLYFNQKDTLRTIEFYSNNQYLSGNKDELGREKPFFNVCNFRVTVAKTNTDLDVKDIRFEPDEQKDSDVVAAMLYNHELYKWMKESCFSQTLNDMGFTRPKYGGLLVKKCMYDGEFKIDVVDWKNVNTDPIDALGGTIIETHWMQPSELLERSDVWYADEIQDAIRAHAKANKNKPRRIEVKEVTGVFSENFDPGMDDTEENAMKFKTMCFYVACINKKKFLVYKEDIKNVKDKYLYCPWDRVPGRGLGRGIVEDGFESQVWQNDAIISIKNAMNLTGKVILQTDSNKISGNAITDVDNGHIFQMEQGRTLTAVNLGPSKMPELQNLIELWNQQYDRASSTYNANTGEAPTAGTPYSQTALLNQVANSPFEYQREVWGIFLNEILNDWVLPYLKKRILKDHYLAAEFDSDDLKLIDEAIQTREVNQMIKDDMIGGYTPTPEDVTGMGMAVEGSLGKLGSRRGIQVPEKFLDVSGRISANITGELKNKQAVLQSLDSILKTVVASYNPNTGQYAVLHDETLSKIFSQIVDAAGINVNSLQLRPGKGNAVPSGNLSAVSPVAPL